MGGDFNYITPISLVHILDDDGGLLIDTKDKLGEEPDSVATLASRLCIMRVLDIENDGFIVDMRYLKVKDSIQVFEDKGINFIDHQIKYGSEALMTAVYTDPEDRLFLAGKRNEGIELYASQLVNYADHIAASLENSEKDKAAEQAGGRRTVDSVFYDDAAIKP